VTTSHVADRPRRSRPGLRVLDLQDVGDHVVAQVSICFRCMVAVHGGSARRTRWWGQAWLLLPARQQVMHRSSRAGVDGL
jgi:hypothetical protein